MGTFSRPNGVFPRFSMQTPAIANSSTPAVSSARLHEMSAIDLAAWIRAGRVSSEEVVRSHIERIAKVNPLINALVHNRFSDALVEARRADERVRNAHRDDALPPLLGVPCTIKEFFAVKGAPQTGGIVAFRDRVATEDAPHVARLRNAGAIVLGTTNIPEGGLWLETDNKIYGRTSNPWNIGRTSGGSSGGEGAIVAAGGAPFGLGSDIGGSIRLPAAFCGVYGHKPGSGVVPFIGQFPAPSPKAAPLLGAGPLARSARDLHPILSIIAGAAEGDPSIVDVPLGDPMGLSASDLRVIALGSFGPRVSSVISSAILRARDLLEGAGAEVVKRSFPGLSQGGLYWTARMRTSNEVDYASILGEPSLSLATELGRVLLGRNERHTLAALYVAVFDRLFDRLPFDVEKILRNGEALREEIEEALGPNGVLLAPVYTSTAPRHNRPLLSPLDAMYTAVFNALEMPGTVVPMGFDDHGLPVGIQILGRRGADHVTLRAALLLEERLARFSPAMPRPR